MPLLEEIISQYYPPRKMLGRVYLPDLTPLAGLNLRFFQYAAPLFVLNPFQTLQQGVVVGHKCYLWGLTGSGVNAQGNATSFGVTIRDGRTRQQFCQKSVDSSSLLGTAQHPFFLRDLHIIPSLRQVDVQVVDKSGVASTVQVVMCVAISDE